MSARAWLATVLASWCVISSAGAQVALTLDEALERARMNSPRLRSLQAQAEAASAATRGARSRRFPQVEIRAGYTRVSDVPEYALPWPIGGTTVLFPNLPDMYASRISAGAPLFTGGQLTAAARAASFEENATESEASAGEADLLFETTTVYWHLSAAREQEHVLREALAAYDAHLRDAQNREELGLAARNEILAVQVERDRAELGRMQAEANVRSATANLLRLTGIEDGTEVIPVELLKVAVEPVPEPDSPESLVRAALARRPERAALAARVRAAEARVQMERGARWPQVNLIAGYDYANPNRRITPPREEWKATWDGGVNVSFSVFDGGRIGAAVDRAEAQARALRESLWELESRIRLEVKTRYLDYATARAAVEVAARAQQAAGENRKVAQDRYREGLVSSSDLLDAEVMLLRAGLERADTSARLRIARADLERAAPGEAP